MKPSKHITDELRGIAPTLSGIDRVHFPAVPAGYLEQFPLKMAELVFEEKTHTILLPQADVTARHKQYNAELPAQYFQNFSTQMLKKVRANELQQVAPVLAAMPVKEQIEVPAGYFVSFPERVKQQIKQPVAATAPGWLGGLNHSLNQLTALIFKPQYSVAFAAAASVLVVAMLYVWQPQKNACAPADLLCQLEKLDAKDLDAYMLTHADEFGESVLEHSVNETEILNQQQFDQSMLQQLTDEELKSFVD